MTTETTYASDLRALVDIAEGEGSNATAVRIRQLLLALLRDSGHQVELGALLSNADRTTTRLILSVIAGWPRGRWSPDLTHPMDFSEAMQARLFAAA